MTEEKKKQIQALLTPFGQTLDDLPHAYTTAERFQARAFAYGLQNSGNYPSYVCYLLDVIDRMETALETALRIADCDLCEHDGSFCSKCVECSQENQFRIRDSSLIAPTIPPCTNIED